MSNNTKNANGIKDAPKKDRPLWLVRSFGTRRVFVTYLICTFITIVSMVISIITSILPELLMRVFPNLLDILVKIFPTMTPEAPTISFEKMIEHVALCVFGL
ncbi:MAG: hypothetical protein LBU70_05800, partial [Chitinispirillales bacterium]|nr:hypothetical protein [Chitinispirillales bacterium]